MKRNKVFYLCLLTLFLFVSGASAGEGDPPPLPLHGIEGYGGVAVTYSAYLVNPPAEGHFFGRPGIGAGGLLADEGRALEFVTITENIGGRLELGYGVNWLDLNDLPEKIHDATGVEIDDDTVQMHNFNARLLLLKEGEFGQGWLPAMTFGVHYKFNDVVGDLDRNLGGALGAIGIEDNQGTEYTLYASKMLSFLPRPVLVNAGVRSSEAAHIGLLGFTGERELLAEGNVVVFLTDRLAAGAEYRQKPDDYTTINGLIAHEDDWWSVVAAYVFNDRLTVSGGYFALGDVLDEEDSSGFALKAKWEF